jgi:dCMP deaminase
MENNIQIIGNVTDYLPPSWDELFMRHVYLIASKSKDKKTKIGAVLVFDKAIISEGYNGFPRRVDDDVPERHERPEKYFWAEHGERNAVYDCARRGVRTVGSILYTNGVPCSDCARAVIQAGVKEVVVHAQWQEVEKTGSGWDKWKESCARSEAMLTEAGVEIRVFDMILNEIAFRDGKVWAV